MRRWHDNGSYSSPEILININLINIYLAIMLKQFPDYLTRIPGGALLGSQEHSLTSTRGGLITSIHKLCDITTFVGRRQHK